MHGMEPHDEIEYWRERAEKAETDDYCEIYKRAQRLEAERDIARADYDRLRAAIRALVGPVCTVCHDTHVMSAAGRVGQCWHCPKPCDKCRGDYGSGPYCRETPCGCCCHGERR